MESSHSVRLLLRLADGRMVHVIADRVGGGNQGSVYRTAGDYPCVLKVFGEAGHPSSDAACLRELAHSSHAMDALSRSLVCSRCTQARGGLRPGGEARLQAFVCPGCRACFRDGSAAPPSAKLFHDAKVCLHEGTAVTLAHVIDGDRHLRAVIMPDLGEPSGSVFRRLHRAGNRRNTIAMALRYLVQVLSQLRSLGEAGAVHSDIKADNIAISQRLGAVLIDFGFAMEATAPPTPGDSCGVMVDTPCGMTATHVAPEAIDAYLASFGEGAHYDAAKADVYACGVTLFEWVFGSAPYSPPIYRHDIGGGRHVDLPGLDRTEQRVAAAFDERVPELNGRVPDALIERLRTVCTGMCNPDHARRLSAAEALRLATDALAIAEGRAPQPAQAEAHGPAATQRPADAGVAPWQQRGAAYTPALVSGGAVAAGSAIGRNAAPSLAANMRRLDAHVRASPPAACPAAAAAAAGSAAGPAAACQAAAADSVWDAAGSAAGPAAACQAAAADSVWDAAGSAADPAAARQAAAAAASCLWAGTESAADSAAATHQPSCHAGITGAPASGAGHATPAGPRSPLSKPEPQQRQRGGVRLSPLLDECLWQARTLMEEMSWLSAQLVRSPSPFSSSSSSSSSSPSAAAAAAAAAQSTHASRAAAAAAAAAGTGCEDSRRGGVWRADPPASPGSSYSAGRRTIPGYRTAHGWGSTSVDEFGLGTGSLSAAEPNCPAKRLRMDPGAQNDRPWAAAAAEALGADPWACAWPPQECPTPDQAAAEDDDSPDEDDDSPDEDDDSPDEDDDSPDEDDDSPDEDDDSPDEGGARMRFKRGRSGRPRRR